MDHSARPLFAWLRDKSAQPQTPMDAYAREFVRACIRTEHLGLGRPPLKVLVQKDCLDMARIRPILQEYMGRYSREDLRGQAFAINVAIAALLFDKLSLPVTLTFGWFDDEGRCPYRHDEAFVEKLVKEGAAKYLIEGLPMHVWLTSPACEILDVTLSTTIGDATRNMDLVGRVIYLSNRTPAPKIIYHPTVIGIDFLEKIGHAI